MFFFVFQINILFQCEQPDDDSVSLQQKVFRKRSTRFRSYTNTKQVNKPKHFIAKSTHLDKFLQVLMSSMMVFLAKLSSHHCDVTLHAAWFRGQRDTVNLSATDQRPIGGEKRDAILKDGKRTSINNWTET